MSLQYLRFIYDRFPRRFEMRQQVTVNTFEELEDLITKYRKTQNCGCTIYDVDGNGHVPTIDKIVFDFDDPARRFEDVKRMHAYFRNVRHFIVFSGRGFHFYLYTRDFTGISHPRA